MTCYKTAEILASIFHVEKLGTETIILELCCQKCKTFKYPSKPVLHTKKSHTVDLQHSVLTSLSTRTFPVACSWTVTTVISMTYLFTSVMAT